MVGVLRMGCTFVCVYLYLIHFDLFYFSVESNYKIYEMNIKETIIEHLRQEGGMTIRFDKTVDLSKLKIT